MDDSSNDKQPLAEKSELSNLRGFPKTLALDSHIVTDMKIPAETPHPKHPGESLNLLIVTWNLMGTLPDSRTIAGLLNAERMKNDLIVIGTD